MTISETIPEDSTLDDIFDALGKQERRDLLVVLDQLETAERLSALARNLATESDVEEAKQLHTELHHWHVPKLEDADLVSRDADQKTVELTDLGETVAECLVE